MPLTLPLPLAQPLPLPLSLSLPPCPPTSLQHLRPTALALALGATLLAVLLLRFRGVAVRPRWCVGPAAARP